MIPPTAMPLCDLPDLSTLENLLDGLVYAHWDGAQSTVPRERVENHALLTRLTASQVRRAIRQRLPKYEEVWHVVETPTHLTFYPRTLHTPVATTLYVPPDATVPSSDEEFLTLENEHMEVLVDTERLIVRRSSGVRLLELSLEPFGVVAGEDVLALLARLKPLFVAAKLDLTFEVSP